MNSLELIAKGTDFIASRENAANKILDKSFKIRLGRGLYGECLVRTCLCVFRTDLLQIFSRAGIDLFIHLSIWPSTKEPLNIDGY